MHNIFNFKLLFAFDVHSLAQELLKQDKILVPKC